MLRNRLRGFMKGTTGFFTTLLIACAFCGVCTFKSNGAQTFKVVRPVGEWLDAEFTIDCIGLIWLLFCAGDLAYGPAVVANAFLAASTVNAATGGWYACPHCMKHDAVRQELVGHMHPDYIRALVSCDQWTLMTLSFLKTPFTLRSWANSFTHGHVNGGVLDNPVIRYTPSGDGMFDVNVDTYILRLFEANSMHNVLFRRFACMLQLGCRVYGHPCVDLRFFGPRTLSTMHRSAGLSCGDDLPNVMDDGNPAYGVLDGSIAIVPREKNSIFEVWDMVVGSMRA